MAPRRAQTKHVPSMRHKNFPASLNYLLSTTKEMGLRRRVSFRSRDFTDPNLGHTHNADAAAGEKTRENKNPAAKKNTMRMSCTLLHMLRARWSNCWQ